MDTLKQRALMQLLTPANCRRNVSYKDIITIEIVDKILKKWFESFSFEIKNPNHNF